MPSSRQAGYLRERVTGLEWSAAMTEPLIACRPPRFDAAFRRQLEELFRWRRDVRRFRTDRLKDGLIDRLIELALLAPSVGNSQPWRSSRSRIHTGGCSSAAASRHATARPCSPTTASGRRSTRLKLSGLDRAPAQLAVFVDGTTAFGHGLGGRTMPETLTWSVVGAVHALWLAARAHGVGLGWVSILEPARVREILAVPQTWSLVAYLCLGWPEEEHLDPELDRAGWQRRVSDFERVVLRR